MNSCSKDFSCKDMKRIKVCSFRAEVCSLVYSFEGMDTDSEKSELKILAELADKKCSELYRDVSELRERDLVQSRDVWRAVLPHAIANRLAEACPRINSNEHNPYSLFSKQIGEIDKIFSLVG